MSCLTLDHPNVVSQKLNMDPIGPPNLSRARGSERSPNLIGALFLPLVFAANIVLATLAWIIVGAV